MAKQQGPLPNYTLDANMKIDIPREKEDIHHSSPAAIKKQQFQQQQQQQQQKIHHNDHHYSNNLAHTALANSVQNLPLQSPASVAPHHDTNSAPPPPRSNANWVYHPRQPNNAADSYFPHSTAGFSNTFVAQSTPIGGTRGHSRQTSGAGLTPSAIVTSRPTKAQNNNMSLSLGGQQNQPDFGNYAEPHHAGPPSPSTLTDIILGLHSTLYGGKKTQEEVRERVAAFYDRDAGK